MALITKRIKGTQDVLPKESYRWQFIKKVLSDEAKNFGYKEIRTPVFENTKLFERGVGETTDVVQKEMYTFETKGKDMITLRPEGTAGTARAVLENALYNEGLPIKAYYFLSCYRYEKPQSGRLREFHQFGVECFGAENPAADAEVIAMLCSIFERFGVKNLSLEINSIGCKECRKKYHEALKEYFEKYKDELCETCLSRLDRNPMRILDCKSPICKKIAEGAPKIIDYLCDECNTHFESVKSYLDLNNIKYTVNPNIVRGLDYYSKTVFEFVSNDLGAQSTVCGGGRYDGLIEELGGQPLPSLGFGLGLERLLLLLDAQNIEIPKPQPCEIYFASMGENANKKAFELSSVMRSAGVFTEFDIIGRGLRPQMKYADKIGAEYSIVIGDSELESNKAEIKNMKNGNKHEITLDKDKIMSEFLDIKIKDELPSSEE